MSTAYSIVVSLGFEGLKLVGEWCYISLKSPADRFDLPPLVSTIIPKA